MPPRTVATRSTRGSWKHSASAPASAAAASTTTRASICESLAVSRDQSFAVGQHVVLDIELPGGNVLLTAARNGTVSVSADGGVPDTFDITQFGDNISIRAKRRGRSARLAVDVPVGTDVSVKGASVDVVARGALGALRVRSASGDV